MHIFVCIFGRGTGKKDLPRFPSVSICIFGRGTGKDSPPSPITNRAQPAPEQTNKQTIHLKKHHTTQCMLYPFPRRFKLSIGNNQR